MRYRIDYRWLLTTGVVVGVAAAGTAAIVHPGNGGGENAPAPAVEVALRRAPMRVAAAIEPARLSHEAGSHVSLSTFDSEALPPVFTSNFDRAREARSVGSTAQAWGWRVKEGAEARGFNNPDNHWFGGAGFGGGVGWGARPSGGVHSVTPAPPPSRNNVPIDTPHPPSSLPSPSPAVPSPGFPSAPHAPGSPFTAPPGLPTSGTGAPPIAQVPPVPFMPDNPPPMPPGGGVPHPGGPITKPLDPRPLSPTPEPASLLLLGTGLAGICGALRRRMR